MKKITIPFSAFQHQSSFCAFFAEKLGHNNFSYSRISQFIIDRGKNNNERNEIKFSIK